MGKQAREKRAAPRRVRFTKTAVAALDPPATGREYVYDSVASGLAICITATGKKTWYIYRRVNGRPERLRLGMFPDLTVEQARDVARAVVGDMAKGMDPIAERRQKRNVPTLAVLFERWANLHAKLHRRAFPEDNRVFEKYLAPFHGTPIDRITTAKVSEWHGQVGEDHGPVMANRAVNLMCTLFNFTPKLGYEGPNPTRGVKRFTETSSWL